MSRGSTRLLRELGAEGYAQALAEHRRAIREACAAEGGVEVDTQGDGSRSAGCRSGCDGSAGLRPRFCPGRRAHRDALLSEEGYVGADVHRASRIAAPWLRHRASCQAHIDRVDGPQLETALVAGRSMSLDAAVEQALASLD
jgi:class 3 adenylate cyclase